MRTLRELAAGIALAATMLIVGCAQLGMTTPQTLNERIAVTISAVTAVRTTATTLLQAGKISSADAVNIQAQADNVAAAAGIAQQLSVPDPKAADAKLQQARAVLAALQSYLAAKQAAGS